MALNTFKCNHLMPLHFKGLKHSPLKTVCAKRYDKTVEAGRLLSTKCNNNKFSYRRNSACRSPWGIGQIIDVVRGVIPFNSLVWGETLKSGR